MSARADVAAAAARVHRDEWPRIVGALTRTTGRVDIAEDAAQEAFALAITRWALDGIPANPAAWITVTARRKAIDRLRREQVGERKHAADAIAALEQPDPSAPLLGDDELALFFLCCHPALESDAQIALTLRAVAGLPTAAIARAFLVPETTMAQRIVRAKRKIVAAGIPFGRPPDELLATRVDAVLTVLYLVFNEGYLASSGARHQRVDLCDEAVRLARLVRNLLPEEPEPAGLLALMLLHDARRAARTNDAGELVLLADQDRSVWDREVIAEGVAIIEDALRRGRPGPYQVQAAIAALHAESPSLAETDWDEIVTLYDLHAERWPSPVVTLNRAVAVGMRDGPEAALKELAALDDDLGHYHLFHSARAELLRRAGRPADAAAAFDAALGLVSNERERDLLERRRADIGEPPH